MKRIEFCCPTALAKAMVGTLEELNEYEECPMVYAYAKYDIAKLILEELIRLGINIDLGIEINTPEWDGYDKEFGIYLSKDGCGCEKKWNVGSDGKETYFDSEPDVAFIHEDCSSAMLSHIGRGLKIEFGFDEDTNCINEYDDCDEIDCSECEFKQDCLEDSEDETIESEELLDGTKHETVNISRLKDGTPTGFTMSWSDENDGMNYYSSYSHYSNDIDMLRKIAIQFGVKL